MTKGDRVLGLFADAPATDAFYTLFEQAGANVEEATALLARLVREWPDDGARLRFELKELETRGDRIAHDLIQHLNVKAATPFSAADAHKLISDLDDVVDLAEEVGDFMGCTGSRRPRSRPSRSPRYWSAPGASWPPRSRSSAVRWSSAPTSSRSTSSSTRATGSSVMH